MTATTLVQSTARSRIIAMLTIGSGTRSSTQTQRHSSTTDAPATPSVAALIQPHRSPSVSASSSADSPADSVSAPLQSSRDGVRTGDSGTSRQTRTRATATGTAPIQKSQVQGRLSRMTPLRTRPTPPPTPKVADSRPRPIPTRSGGSSSRTIPKASGNSAPAAPCSARAAIRAAIELARAAPMVPTRKISITTTSRRFLP